MKLLSKIGRKIAALAKPSRHVRRLAQDLQQSRSDIRELKILVGRQAKAIEERWGTEFAALERRMRKVEAFSTAVGSVGEAGELVSQIQHRLGEVEEFTNKLSAEKISETMVRLSAQLEAVQDVLSRSETRMTGPRLSSLERHVESLLSRAQGIEEAASRDTARLAALARRQLLAETAAG